VQNLFPTWETGFFLKSVKLTQLTAIHENLSYACYSSRNAVYSFFSL